MEGDPCTVGPTLKIFEDMTSPLANSIKRVWSEYNQDYLNFLFIGAKFFNVELVIYISQKTISEKY